jgi:hypothetical protein
MTQICDENGRTIGYFLTVAEHARVQRLEAEHRRLLYDWAKAQFTAEELDRAEQDPEELTTTEVLRHLEKL